MSLHPNLEPIAALIGTFRGPGSGEYPTIDSFEYTEEVTFTDIGKPLLAYAQRTWALDGRPLHVETGYLRVPSGDRVEFVLAQPTGQTELAEGTLTPELDGFSMELRSRVVNAASAKLVDQTVRRLQLRGTELTTTFAMAAVGVPLNHHLSSLLTRADPAAA